MYEQPTTNATPLQILDLRASGRHQGSVSRLLSAELISALESRHGSVDVTVRDLARGVPFVDEAWINANFTSVDDRNPAQHEALAYSDQLIAELQDADVIVMGVPIYNFGVPAALKAWIDMIARARVTFRYTEHGPQGLLQGKKAYIVIASGGVAVGSKLDFATPYLRHALSFVGIDDIEFIAAEQLNNNHDESMDAARVRIAELVYTASDSGSRAA
ncbi:MAG: NAD(P)H-dependent oxidoreductase [Gammaproteobacteria bacterium]|nr:NAD(P)H-dependent oxidoreductase [Gammaproteobacteria bacterium]MDH3434451.1 NAD(P)H-dependent oxidoreductase [Gammaproteobacteria bacterium]